MHALAHAAWKHAPTLVSYQIADTFGASHKRTDEFRNFGNWRVHLCNIKLTECWTFNIEESRREFTFYMFGDFSILYDYRALTNFGETSVGFTESGGTFWWNFAGKYFRNRLLDFHETSPQKYSKIELLLAARIMYEGISNQDLLLWKNFPRKNCKTGFSNRNFVGKILRNKTAEFYRKIFAES